MLIMIIELIFFVKAFFYFKSKFIFKVYLEENVNIAIVMNLYKFDYFIKKG